jgi:adenosylhomocysteine nucleosidase
MADLIVVLISANAEWRVVREILAPQKVETTPYGECFEQAMAGRQLLFMQGGWGKISAAGSAQYALDHWKPVTVINLGTCGGIQGRVKAGDVILADDTLVYDIIERMGDPQDALQHYATHLDLSWLKPPYPQAVQRGRLLSADQDIDPQMAPTLVSQYYTAAVDWESGAIAWVCAHNNTRCLILRAVSDLVGPAGGEAYQDGLELFHQRARLVMTNLLDALPGWLACMDMP